MVGISSSVLNLGDSQYAFFNAVRENMGGRVATMMANKLTGHIKAWGDLTPGEITSIKKIANDFGVTFPE